MILLVRHAAHGHLGAVLTGRLPGVPLSEAGRAQAARLAERLTRDAPTALLHSPRQRARETADIVAPRLGLQASEEQGLDEFDFGRWSGQSFAALEADPDWRRWNAARGGAATPAGDTMAAVGRRARAALEGLAGVVVAVTHADVIKAVLLDVLGLTADAHDRIEIAAASISRVELWPGGGRVLGINEEVA